MAVSKRLRYEILRRDNHACRYCGAAAPTVKLNVDHVIPTSLGGSDKPDNLVSSCAACNAGKTSSMPNATPVADVDQATFRQAAELQAAADRRANARRRSQPSTATVRAAFRVHLIAVWTWAWNKRAHTQPTDEQEMQAFEHLALLADGSDMTSNQLTEIAFRAGSAQSVKVMEFVNTQLSEEQFALGADAVNQWWDSWEDVDGTGPSADHTAAFCDSLHALVILLDAVKQRDMVLAAAARAGRQKDPEIGRHLAAPAQS
ncbi:HNH endonuclease [Streptomyces virginiae]|uniref:HNH endonuclease n=1 Tax=Streptomyces virginiae TaxID=1961 RepID=UPI00344EE525